MKFTVLSLAFVAAASTAFAGGTEEPIYEAPVAVAVTEGASSSNVPWWAVAAGVVAVGVALSNSN
jgi:hypothetical protein